MNNAKTMTKITNHYQNAISDQKMQKIYIDEWDMDIYFRNTYSFKDEAKVIEYQTAGKPVEALVESLIVKARDKDGKRIFSDADRSTLLNEADPSVITRVCTAISNANLRVTGDQAAKE
ncbi:MAG: hypothetical protein CBB97_07830 [Candidatus Endolissoclinum sp. TMED37]|nr:MAG: hypothetical protein CBB97_07830 [Candidatus Endolissoclinum sp. TMED37]|tara:strand:- start:3284 stop:3640 length:357 start_codon:yes stop_codon:yes gene_type:complete